MRQLPLCFLSLAVVLALAGCAAPKRGATDATNPFPPGTLTGASETNTMYMMVVELELEDGYKPGPLYYCFRPQPPPRITKDCTRETVVVHVGNMPEMTVVGCSQYGGSRLTILPQPNDMFFSNDFGLRVNHSGTFKGVRREWEEYIPLQLGHSTTGRVGVVCYRATWKTAPGAPRYRPPTGTTSNEPLEYRATWKIEPAAFPAEPPRQEPKQ